MTVETLWYLGRGTGLVSTALLSLVVVLGIVNRSSRPVAGLPRFAIAVIHRNASLLAVAFLAVHVLTLLLDPFARLRVYDLVLPFVGQYRAFWLGLGTLALDLMAAIVVTSLLRHRLGVRAWRLIHWAAYAAWPVAIAHSIGTGTDNTSPWLLITVAVSVAGVLGAIAWRLSDRFTEDPATAAAPAWRPPAPVGGARAPAGGPR